MPEVKFAAYRQYLEQRQIVNSSVMALLAGSQLASNTLQLTEGSARTMREIFPRVTHIDRFNLKSDDARALLLDAEAHLSAMAIPYILTIQESLYETFESMLTAAGVVLPRNSAMTSPVWIVKKYWEAQGVALDLPSWQVFELLTAMRHDITHRAGRIGAESVKKAAAMNPKAVSIFQRMSKKNPPVLVVGQKHVLDHADMVVCLAVVKFLADEGNTIMQGSYPRNLWLRDMVDDMADTRRLIGNPTQRFRKTRTFARDYYGVLGFTDQEIQAEVNTRT